MNVTKCESDPDGESFLTSSDSENEPMDMKEEKDHLLMKFPVRNSENECLQNNSDTIKVEREIRLLPHAVDTLIEGDVANNKRDLPLSPVCPLVKCETEVITDFIKCEPNSCCGTYVSPSHNENEMTGTKEEEDPLLLTFPLTQTENEVLIMNPGNDGERFSWNHLNLQSEHQLKTDYTSPVQLSEYQNQVLLRRARNAERKRRSRQTRKAKETLEEAAERRAQHAEQVRRWRQSRLATETPQVAASRRAQHAEIMRQWRQSHRSNETPDEAASRRAQQTAQVLVMNPGNDGERLSRSQRNPQSGHRRLNERSKSHVQDSVRRARNAERMRRWRCSRQANETLQEAALRRAQHAEVVRNWRLSRRANETPQVAAPRRAQQTAQEGSRVLSPEDQSKWLKAKEEACLSGASSNSSLLTGFSLLCPQVWDTIMCWPTTPAGKTHEQPCAHYFAGFDPQAIASKLCLSTGEWFRDDSNRTWTNYSLCFTEQTFTVAVNFSEIDNNPLISEYFPVLKTIAQVGYAVSLTTLIVAFCILAAIKKLRCPRNMLHLHLFVSFIMRAFMALLKDIIFVSGVGLPMDVIEKNGSSYFYDQNSWLCRTVTSVWQYCIMANYSWILMEGLYLHNLIFLALFSDTSSITLYVVLGWGLPALCVLPWVAARVLLENTLCWTTNSSELLFLIIRGPTTISILLNFILFVNIVRVLLLKLRASVCDETRTYRRWAKSTLVLVPLFGVHYTVFLGMSYSMGVHPGVEIVWLFCDQLFASFQGFFVAVLYCFLNGEVRAELKRQWLHSGSLRGIFCRPLRPGHCYSSTDCSSLSMGPPGSSGRKLRPGGKRLSTSFMGPNMESRHNSTPNASEATAVLGFDSRWCQAERNMPGCHIEMGHINAH